MGKGAKIPHGVVYAHVFPLNLQKMLISPLKYNEPSASVSPNKHLICCFILSLFDCLEFGCSCLGAHEQPDWYIGLCNNLYSSLNGAADCRVVSESHLWDDAGMWKHAFIDWQKWQSKNNQPKQAILPQTIYWLLGEFLINQLDKALWILSYQNLILSFLKKMTQETHILFPLRLYKAMHSLKTAPCFLGF